MLSQNSKINMTSKPRDLLFLSFNQDATCVEPRSLSRHTCTARRALIHTLASCAVFCSCISVGTREGFGVFSCEPFGRCFHEPLGGIGVAEMLYCTSLVALVGAGEQVRPASRLTLQDIEKG